MAEQQHHVHKAQVTSQVHSKFCYEQTNLHMNLNFGSEYGLNLNLN